MSGRYGVRHDLAVRYFSDRGWQLTRVAERLGYAQLSSFTRWFVSRSVCPHCAGRRNGKLGLIGSSEGRSNDAQRDDAPSTDDGQQHFRILRVSSLAHLAGHGGVLPAQVAI